MKTQNPMLVEPKLYTYQIGFNAGADAAKARDKYRELNPTEWHKETTDYANGYREGYKQFADRKN